ncbi:hypothetical protein NIASO_05045 [Niabella soli DSM 19437]|uniref:Uncharacterized protein n=1 Tax=Niabella soli DSM 19437 TaxID=929713 RepID=W0F7E6_9BACT|nr:hypothetical protein NIASO_05045 [Niabella soli DSM 19437]
MNYDFDEELVLILVKEDLILFFNSVKVYSGTSGNNH